jgi:uncharacterized protein YbaR (Trm112 family)
VNESVKPDSGDVLADYMSDMLAEDAPPAGASADDAEPAEYYMIHLYGIEIGIPAGRVCTAAPLPESLTAGNRPGVLHAESRGTRYTVIDPAPVLLPPDMPNLDVPVADRADHLVLLDEGQWGIVAESPAETARVADRDVCWRGPRARRRWLAGAVPERRGVLIDVDGLYEDALGGEAPA